MIEHSSRRNTSISSTLTRNRKRLWLLFLCTFFCWDSISAPANAGEPGARLTAKLTEQTPTVDGAKQQKANAQKASTQRASAQRASEQKASEQKASEQKASEQKASEQRASELRASTQREGPQRLSGQPPLILWAWERPSDLRFIDSNKTGIAYLAATIVLQSDELRIKPRLQPLFFPPNTYKIATIRVETSRVKQPTLSIEQAQELSKQVLRIALTRKINCMQIDFDARQTEREFYFHFLNKLSKSMPPTLPLSITSLSSWCLRDTWIAKMPCDEVVPMFFSMGAARAEAIDLLNGGSGLAKMPMQTSIGLSVDEGDILRSLKQLPKHVYLFSTHGWNNENSIKWVKAFEDNHESWKKL